MDADTTQQTVLVITNIGPHSKKIQKHFEPLAAVADDVTMVRRTPGVPVEGISYVTTEGREFGYIDLLLVFFNGIWECCTKEYDVVVTVSMFPYGIFGAIIGFLFGLPTHHRVIGSDINVHSKAWYQRVTVWLLSSFTSISVHGSNHKEYLVSRGIPEEDIEILPGSIDTTTYKPNPDVSTVYDFIWVGKMVPVKQPLLFVDSLAELRERGLEFDAVMLGAGPLNDLVERRVEVTGLGDSVSLPGWVDASDIVEYYHRADSFVMTSSKDAFGFPLVEAMAAGLVSVAPKRQVISDGNTTDIVTHMETGLVVKSLDAESIADAMEKVLTDSDLQDRLSEQAPAVRDKFSRERMRDRWGNVLRALAEQS